jgi:single-stranded-DNA-specific exonuclease
VLRETDPLSPEPRWKALAQALGCHPLLARVLVARGIETPEEARAFLNPSEADLLPPEAVPGLARARDRLSAAVANREPVLIHGDYDADGIIGTVILHSTLKELGCPSRIFLPERSLHGYGLASQAVKKAVAAGIRLMVSVDCGISSHETIAEARDAGIEVIVTDHHAMPEHLPSDAILVHPDLEGKYPDGDIAGAAVAYKLSLSLLAARGGDVEAARESYLPLVALATVADVCPLTGENRAIVGSGLKGIPTSRVPGLRTLWLGTRREGESGPVTARDAAFGLAPVLNAAGRMGDPFPAARLLLAGDEDTAWKHLRVLLQTNRERKKAQAETLRRLRSRPEVAWGSESKGILVLVDECCAPGLAGLAAARLAEETGRPTCVLAPCEDETGLIYRGSMRSAGAEDLLELMAPVDGISEHLGGHAGALGLTVRRERLGEFLKACEEIAWTPKPPELTLDFAVDRTPTDPEAVTALDATRPWGEGNPQPAFMWGPVRVKGTRAVGKGGEHVQVTLHSEDGAIIKGIGFSMSRYLDEESASGRMAQTAGHFLLNEWQGRSSVEFQLRDLDFL